MVFESSFVWFECIFTSYLNRVANMIVSVNKIIINQTANHKITFYLCSICETNVITKQTHDRAKPYDVLCDSLCNKSSNRETFKYSSE